MKLKAVYRSNKDKAQLSIQLRHYKKDVTKGEIQLHFKTKFIVSKKEYDKGIIDTDTNYAINKCIDYITKEFLSKGENFIPNKEWMHKKCNKFFNNKEETKPLLIDWVNDKIEQCEFQDNSIRRIKNLKQLVTIVKNYDSHLEMTDLTLDELDKFKLWLMKEQKYGINTANGIIADIKTVCREATPKIQFPNDYIYWKKYKQTKASKFKTKKIITLTKDEIERIENLELTEKHLINARKWLIIGVNTAQRGSELLELTKDSFKYDKSGSLVIDFSQSKVGQAMRIPALKRVKKLYESEKLPYKISIQKLNNHLKTLGKKAKIVDLIDWKLKEKVIVNDKQVMRHVQKTRPKYEYIASHIFRRTFCTYYMEMGVDEADIRKISGHKSKEMLMNYVREARPDFSEWEKYM